MTILDAAGPSIKGDPQQRGRLSKLGRLALSEYFVLVLCVAYVVAVSPFVPELLSWEVAGDVVSDMMPLLVVAVGQTFVLVVAGIDLSATAIISMAAVVGASIMSNSGGLLAGSPVAVPMAVASMLALGLAVGVGNGLAATRLNMPPFIVTLATRMFLAGSAIWYTTFHTASSSIADLPDGFDAFADGSVYGVPNTLLLAGAVTGAAHVVLSRSQLGRWLVAVGSNARTARISGIPVERTVVIAFAISGLCAATTAVIYASRMQTGSPIAGENILLDIIGAVVIGGTSLFGGKGKVIWTVFGVLFLVILDTSMKLLGASLFAIYIIKGGVILVAAIVDTFRHRILVGSR